MLSYNLPSVTQSLFRNHLLRSFVLLCNIPCTIDRFLVTDVLNIISSLPRAFHFAPELVGVMSIKFTNLIKVDADVNEMSLSNI